MPGPQTRKENSTPSSMVGLQDLSEQGPTLAPVDDVERLRDHEKAAAYRKLYGIVTIMTFLLFVLNIVQVCLLDKLSSLYWILICPGVIFLAFTSWACVFVYSNLDLFYSEPWQTRNDRTHAWDHFKALFILQGRSQRSHDYGVREPNWPIRFSRAGILLTAFLNIILCQFIYLPIFAVPAFDQIVWKMESNSSHNITTPSFAVLQDIGNTRRAGLEDNNATIAQLCQEKSEVQPTQFCFEDVRNMTYSTRTHGNVTTRYALFNGTEHPSMDRADSLDLLYRYYYHGDAPDPLLELAVFDQGLTDDFEEAFQCGIIATSLFPANKRVQIALQQAVINDDKNAMDLSPPCRKKTFQSHSSYEVDVTYLGAPSAPGHNQCNLDQVKFNGSCNGDLTVYFSTDFAKIYTSDHGKHWITILTDEGGVVGFVTFLTWFFGIFNI